MRELGCECACFAGGRVKLPRRWAAPAPARAAALWARAGAQVTTDVRRSAARGALAGRGTAEAACCGVRASPEAADVRNEKNRWDG